MSAPAVPSSSTLDRPLAICGRHAALCPPLCVPVPGETLFVQQDELLTGFDLIGGDRHQLLGWAYGARQQPVRGLATGVLREAFLEKIDELAATSLAE